MKTMTRLFALAVVALPLAGCGGDNDKAVMVDTTGKPQQEGVTPPNAPRSSKDFMTQQAKNDPLKNNKDYQNAGR